MRSDILTQFRCCLIVYVLWWITRLYGFFSQATLVFILVVFWIHWVSTDIVFLLKLMLSHRREDGREKRSVNWSKGVGSRSRWNELAIMEIERRVKEERWWRKGKREASENRTWGGKWCKERDTVVQEVDADLESLSVGEGRRFWDRKCWMLERMGREWRT